MEVVAHFIVLERENQVWITDLINDDERWSDRYENPTNTTVRLRAIVAVRPTIEEMLEEMRRSEAETVAMLAALPPELVAHKGSYVRLGRGLMQLTLAHMVEHAAQIREAIQAAPATMDCTTWRAMPGSGPAIGIATPTMPYHRPSIRPARPAVSSARCVGGRL